MSNADASAPNEPSIRRLGVRPRRGTSDRGLPDPAGDQDGPAPECRGASFGADGVTGRSRGLRDSPRPTLPDVSHGRYEHGVLRSNRVGLRARHEADVPILQSELYDDVAVRSRADSRPWRPIAPGSAASPYAVAEPSEDAACFSVVDLSSDELAGETLLWGIDTHNRTAHVGISLRPAFRNRGLGTDVLRVLCGYGFAVRGLHRLQLETLADNTAMIQAATRVGFTQEGVLRRSAWANGGFADEVILGLLAAEWNAAAGHGRASSS